MKCLLMRLDSSSMVNLLIIEAHTDILLYCTNRNINSLNFRAFILIPNVIWFKSFGKVLFCISDIVIGLLLEQILKITGKYSKKQLNFYLAIWLLNPIAINVSTRGNAESLVSFVTLAALWAILNHFRTLGSIV